MHLFYSIYLFLYSVVEVDFESGSYQFYEGELMSHDIYLRLSTSIAQSLSVFVSGGEKFPKYRCMKENIYMYM